MCFLYPDILFLLLFNDSFACEFNSVKRFTEAYFSPVNDRLLIMTNLFLENFSTQNMCVKDFQQK